MKKNEHRHIGPLTFAMGLCLVLYHSANWWTAGWPTRLGGWRDSRVHWVIHGKDWIDVTLPVRYDTPQLALDRSTEFLRDQGYRLQYRLGRLPEFIFAGEAKPHRRLYLREEVYLQFAESARLSREGFGVIAPPFVEALEKAGVTVLILPVPTKISQERERLPTPLPAETLWFQGRTPPELLREKEDPAAAYRQYVDTLPSHVIDLFSLFQKEQRENPGEPLYLPAGSHWSSRGIAVSAAAAIQRLRERGWPLRAPELLYENRFTPDYNADLVRALLLPESLLASSPEFQWWEPIFRIKPVRDGRDNGRVIVAGSCYSRRLAENYGLGALLGEALGRLHIDASLDFSPAVLPINRLTEEGVLLQRGDLLVWEFPVRRPPLPTDRLEVPRLIDEPARRILSQ